MSAQLPTIQARRALIEQKRDTFRSAAFDAEIEAEAIAVQTVGVAVSERNRALRQLADKASNCYASAARMDVLLAELDAQIAQQKAEA